MSLTLKKALSPLLPPNMRAAILGVGSELCKDDFAGMAAVERLMPYSSDDLLILGGSNAPENCTGRIRAFKPCSVIVIDAAHMGRAVGEYALIDPKRITGATFSTHMLPLPVTLSYLEAVCGCVTAYIGIEPASTEQGIGMCEEVRRGVEGLTQELISIIAAR